MGVASSRRPAVGLSRRRSGRLIAGVAGGVADRLGTSASYVRAAFVVTAVLWGVGLVVYVALWMATFDDVDDDRHHPLEGRQEVGLGLLFVGGLLVFRSVGWWPGDPLVVMTAALAFGMAVLGEYDWVGRLFDPDRARPSKLRVLGGGFLLLVGLLVFGNSISRVPTLGAVAVAVTITAVGVGLVFGPWLVTLGRQLGSERAERIRQEERAEMAAHLHDSVLQTLALMQRTDDPRRMVTLARQQERELRSWLFDPKASSTETRLAAAVSQAGARVEADFTVPVEVVTVGDAALDDTARALLAASTEAMVNAAKHSGANEVSVYVEVADGRADVFVADLGNGFDVTAIPLDRRGLSESITRRMERAGGGASVDTCPGEGTEIHLWASASPVDATDGGALVIRVFLVDDHALFLSGVRSELAAMEDRFEVVGAASDVDQAITDVRDLTPDVVLVDVHMPGGGGLAVIQNVTETHPEMTYLALSVSDAAEDVIAMIRAGARGYVTKSISSADLADAIERVHAGDAVFSPRLAGFVLDAFAHALPAEADPELDQLTPREKEVLRLIARGYPYKQVARRLSISVKTVETHVSSVLRKLQLSSRHELSRWASDRRIV